MPRDAALARKSGGPEPEADFLQSYLESLSLIERLHRLLLDVIKDELERVGRFDINAVQALLIFNIGDKVMAAGELRNRGYYQGSNVSYNLKKLVEAGYIDHQRSDVDRRAVRVSLTGRGLDVRQMVADLFTRHCGELADQARWKDAGLGAMIADMRGIERFWSDQIRYIY